MMTMMMMVYLTHDGHQHVVVASRPAAFPPCLPLYPARSICLPCLPALLLVCALMMMVYLTHDGHQHVVVAMMKTVKVHHYSTALYVLYVM